MCKHEPLEYTNFLCDKTKVFYRAETLNEIIYIYICKHCGVLYTEVVKKSKKD